MYCTCTSGEESGPPKPSNGHTSQPKPGQFRLGQLIWEAFALCLEETQKQQTIPFRPT